MNERTRYRVTGSVFLIALAVIFLPMLFDGAGAPMNEVPLQPQIAYTPKALPAFEDVVPTSDVVTRVEDLREEIDDGGFAADNGTRFGEPVLLPVDANTTIWAVQTASFASRENAVSFRLRLRAAGYEAFISTVKDTSSDSGRMHRVAIGPLLSNLDAKDIRSAVGEKFDVSPTVVEMTQ
jgi:DedD protein